MTTTYIIYIEGRRLTVCEQSGVWIVKGTPIPDGTHHILNRDGTLFRLIVTKNGVHDPELALALLWEKIRLAVDRFS